MKGIILAGGTGSRLWPATLAVSKQLIPVYDKPMIYYPISTLMLANIRDILIITTADEEDRFKKLLKDGSHWGIRISYQVQEKPRGLAEAFILGREFIGKDEVCLILGDNLFHGHGLGRKLAQIRNIENARIFGYEVANASKYGVLEVGDSDQIINLVEKPFGLNRGMAIPGLYFYPNDVVEIAAKLSPSARGELEITDLNLVYLSLKRLDWSLLGRDTVWLDMGNFSDLLAASNMIETLQSRQSFLIGSPDEISLNQKWLSSESFKSSIEIGIQNSYYSALKQIL